MPKRSRQSQKSLSEVPALNTNTWRILFAGLPFPVWVCDETALHLYYVNEAARTYGCGPAELTFTSFRDLLKSDSVSAFDEALLTHRNQEIDVEHIMQDDTSVSARLSLSWILEAERELIVIVSHKIPVAKILDRSAQYPA